MIEGKKKQGLDLEVRDVQAAIEVWKAIARGAPSPEMRAVAERRLQELAERMERLVERMRAPRGGHEAEQVEAALNVPVFEPQAGWLP